MHLSTFCRSQIKFDIYRQTHSPQDTEPSLLMPAARPGTRFPFADSTRIRKARTYIVQKWASFPQINGRTCWEQMGKNCPSCIVWTWMEVSYWEQTQGPTELPEARIKTEAKCQKPFRLHCLRASQAESSSKPSLGFHLQLVWQAWCKSSKALVKFVSGDPYFFPFIQNWLLPAWTESFRMSP